MAGYVATVEARPIGGYSDIFIVEVGQYPLKNNNPRASLAGISHIIFDHLSKTQLILS